MMLLFTRLRECILQPIFGAALLACLTLPGYANAESLAEQATPLAQALSHERYISYVPRSFSMRQGTPQPANPAGIRADLKKLHPYFSGLITYGLGNGQETIPELAIAAGFRSVILGVWDPKDHQELDLAIALARRYPQQITALVLGNEGLFWKRYTSADITAAAAYVRKQLPQLALGSSEPFSVYLDTPDAAALFALDLILPNVHPRFEPWFDPANTDQAVTFVIEVLQRLHERTDKPILIKETGLPSGPAEQGFNEVRQAAFWSTLLQRTTQNSTQNIACFEAFDAPWKPVELQDEFGHLEPSEAHWGLFDQHGRAKLVINALGNWPPTATPPAVSIE
ncbi:MAG: hypothetical protein KKE76_05915 [Gammaproteobacteria bacterium]|nr:hypothetical protein [Gammaproteobacteria bacterium]